jgi:hypothetical protein
VGAIVSVTASAPAAVRWTDFTRITAFLPFPCFDLDAKVRSSAASRPLPRALVASRAPSLPAPGTRMLSVTVPVFLFAFDPVILILLEGAVTVTAHSVLALSPAASVTVSLTG